MICSRIQQNRDGYAKVKVDNVYLAQVFLLNNISAVDSPIISLAVFVQSRSVKKGLVKDTLRHEGPYKFNSILRSRRHVFTHCHSRTSNKSHFSSLVTLKRAKAQATIASIKYAEELKLRNLKAEIDEKEKHMLAKEKSNMERSRAEFEAEVHLLSVKKKQQLLKRSYAFCKKKKDLNSMPCQSL